MNAPARISSLPSLVDRASRALAGAKSAAEILEAKEAASFAYDAAKKAARLSKAKGAHDTLIAAAHRAQADALEIEAGAKRRLADEYDAAQERGEVATRGGERSGKEHSAPLPTAEDIGLTRKDIHEAREIRDAEEAEPGIVRRVLDERLEAGEEPTKAAVRKAVIDAAKRGIRGGSSRPSNKNPHYRPPSEADTAWTHVYGTARAFVEWASQKNIQLAIKGLEDRDDNQAGNIRAVRECAAVLSTIVERIDAEHS